MDTSTDIANTNLFNRRCIAYFFEQVNPSRLTAINEILVSYEGDTDQLLADLQGRYPSVDVRKTMLECPHDYIVPASALSPTRPLSASPGRGIPVAQFSDSGRGGNSNNGNDNNSVNSMSVLPSIPPPVGQKAQPRQMASNNYSNNNNNNNNNMPNQQEQQKSSNFVLSANSPTASASLIRPANNNNNNPRWGQSNPNNKNSPRAFDQMNQSPFMQPSSSSPNSNANNPRALGNNNNGNNNYQQQQQQQQQPLSGFYTNDPQSRRAIPGRSQRNNDDAFIPDGAEDDPDYFQSDRSPARKAEAVIFRQTLSNGVGAEIFQLPNEAAPSIYFRNNKKRRQEIEEEESYRRTNNRTIGEILNRDGGNRNSNNNSRSIQQRYSDQGLLADDDEEDEFFRNNRAEDQTRLDWKMLEDQKQRVLLKAKQEALDYYHDHPNWRNRSNSNNNNNQPATTGTPLRQPVKNNNSITATSVDSPRPASHQPYFLSPALSSAWTVMMGGDNPNNNNNNNTNSSPARSLQPGHANNNANFISSAVPTHSSAVMRRNSNDNNNQTPLFADGQSPAFQRNNNNNNQQQQQPIVSFAQNKAHVPPPINTNINNDGSINNNNISPGTPANAKQQNNNSNNIDVTDKFSPYYIEGLQLPANATTLGNNTQPERLNVDHGPGLNKQETYTTEVYGKK